MSKKIKALIAVGGTGGHVFPGCNLANHLIEKGFDVDLVTDKRGNKYLKNFQKLNISILPSVPLNKKNIFTIFSSFILIFFFIFRSMFFLLFNRPKIVFGMGGYASFPICIAATILKIKLVIYENNLIIGKANRYLLPFAKKILVSFRELEGIPKRYESKIFEIGNIIKKEILNLPYLDTKNEKKQLIKILVLGGSQAAKIFAEKLPIIFRNCSNKGISLKIYQQCLSIQNDSLNLFYKENNIDCEIFNFSYNLEEYFSKADIAITRSGSSMLAELTNASVPFISIPLPSSADNHQLKNALHYEQKKISFLVEEKDLHQKLLKLIENIYKDNSILNEIIQVQRQYSDKNVYNNINLILKQVLNEKN